MPLYFAIYKAKPLIIHYKIFCNEIPEPQVLVMDIYATTIYQLVKDRLPTPTITLRCSFNWQSSCAARPQRSL